MKCKSIDPSKSYNKLAEELGITSDDARNIFEIHSRGDASKKDVTYRDPGAAVCLRLRQVYDRLDDIGYGRISKYKQTETREVTYPSDSTRASFDWQDGEPCIVFGERVLKWAARVVELIEIDRRDREVEKEQERPAEEELFSSNIRHDIYSRDLRYRREQLELLQSHLKGLKLKLELTDDKSHILALNLMISEKTAEIKEMNGRVVRLAELVDVERQNPDTF